MSKDIVTYYDVMAEMWCAYFDGPPDEVQSVKYGFGDTEEQAIQELKDLNND